MMNILKIIFPDMSKFQIFGIFFHASNVYIDEGFIEKIQFI